MSTFRRRLLMLNNRPLELPAWFRQSIVCWYDPIKQGCTNANMAENPVLKDLSGHGLDMTCHNFAWTRLNGIDETGALYFDGISSFCAVRDDSLKSSFASDFTVIVQRMLLKEGGIYDGFGIASNSGEVGTGAFIFEYKDKKGLQCISRGVTSQLVPLNYNMLDISCMTKNIYNGISIPSGEAMADNMLCLGGVRDDDVYYQYSYSKIYSALFFNRALTTEEIEWVKNRLTHVGLDKGGEIEDGDEWD